MNSRSPAAIELTVTLRDERDAKAGAVRIAARGADILGRGGRRLLDPDIDRALELDDDNPARELDGRFHLFRELDDDARVAVLGGDADIALDGLRGCGARRREHEDRGKDGDACARPPRTPSARRMVCTALAFWFAPVGLIVIPTPEGIAGSFNFR